LGKRFVTDSGAVGLPHMTDNSFSRQAAHAKTLSGLRNRDVAPRFACNSLSSSMTWRDGLAERNQTRKTAVD
jgi:hypothetical protein